jgi:hypothetical protein
VPPPVGTEWIPDAVKWLLDHAPAEYRGYPLLRRQPLVLARFVTWHIDGCRTATDQGLARVRTSLERSSASVVHDAIAVLESEQARLELVARAAAALTDALTASARGR